MYGDRSGPRAPRTVLVIGGGGVIGSAWATAALHHLVAGGHLEQRSLSQIHASGSGAELGALLAAGVEAAELVAWQRGAGTDDRLPPQADRWSRDLPPRPRSERLAPAWRTEFGGVQGRAGQLPVGTGRAAWLQQVAYACLGGNPWPQGPELSLVALDRGTGRRRVFTAATSAEADLGSVLKAAWATPGWIRPQPLGDTEYLDASVASPASLDLVPNLADAEPARIFVIAPLASPPGNLGPGLAGALEARLYRRPLMRILAAEVRQQRQAGHTVIPILPTAEDLRGIGVHFMRGSRRARALEAALATAGRTVRRAVG